ncbi:MAG: Gfo/Idh/MocA family oxidoreductase [Terracidiphilus sp.]|jgi:predicted dehydrogenase
MIRVGLVGFGMAGRVFHAPLLSSVEGLELAAVVERHSDLAAQRYPGIATHRSFEAMLADSSLGLFVVATPSGTHFEVARQILEAGRNVVVDKPMSTTSNEIAQLMELAAARHALLIPFHNRRWDSDFQTLYKLIREGSLGRLAHLQSNLDRWSPGSARRAWKDDPAQGGGILLDLGTHLADQALALFGKPEAVGAEVLRERSGEGSNDAFTLRLRYPGFSVTLAANCLSSLARPRYHLRGTKGNYWKWGLEPQEAALNQITRIGAAPWGQEPPANWGTLSVDVDGGMVTHPVAPIPGDYRLYYAGVRDALIGKSHAPVSALAAWRVARLLEWAAASSDQRREIICDWSDEPERRN